VSFALFRRVLAKLPVELLLLRAQIPRQLTLGFCSRAPIFALSSPIRSWLVDDTS